MRWNGGQPTDSWVLLGGLGTGLQVAELARSRALVISTYYGPGKSGTNGPGCYGWPGGVLSTLDALAAYMPAVCFSGNRIDHDRKGGDDILIPLTMVD